MARTIITTEKVGNLLGLLGLIALPLLIIFSLFQTPKEEVPEEEEE